MATDQQVEGAGFVLPEDTDWAVDGAAAIRQNAHAAYNLATGDITSELITDATTVGRAVLTAADATAARTALSAAATTHNHTRFTRSITASASVQSTDFNATTPGRILVNASSPINLTIPSGISPAVYRTLHVLDRGTARVTFLGSGGMTINGITVSTGRWTAYTIIIISSSVCDIYPGIG